MGLFAMMRYAINFHLGLGNAERCLADVHARHPGAVAVRAGRVGLALHPVASPARAPGARRAGVQHDRSDVVVVVERC